MRRGGGEDLGSDPYQFIYTNDQLRREPQQLHVFHLRSKPALRCVHRCPIPNGVARVCHHPACGRHGYKTIVLLLTQKPVYGGSSRTSRTCTHPTPIAKSSSIHARRSCAPRNWVRCSSLCIGCKLARWNGRASASWNVPSHAIHPPRLRSCRRLSYLNRWVRVENHRCPVDASHIPRLLLFI